MNDSFPPILRTLDNGIDIYSSNSDGWIFLILHIYMYVIYIREKDECGRGVESIGKVARATGVHMPAPF